MFVLAVLLMVALIVVLSFIPTLLWYCVDDFLAVLFNNPGLGEIPWYVVYVVFIIMSMIFKSTSSSNS